jgi:hypothetical protein
VLSARQLIGAATTALSLITGAFLLALAAGNARAQGSAPECDAAGEIALLPSPWAPWKGAPQRNAAGKTAALDGSCPIARTSLELFCAMLGTIAGNAALMFGARGGVYIAGSIAPRLTGFLARSEFRARFERKGRLRTYVASIPASVIVHPAATFLGLKSIAKRTSAASRAHPLAADLLANE